MIEPPLPIRILRDIADGKTKPFKVDMVDPVTAGIARRYMEELWGYVCSLTNKLIK
jgi:hypothetical protein